jgi:hypothetical protein
MPVSLGPQATRVQAMHDAAVAMTPTQVQALETAFKDGLAPRAPMSAGDFYLYDIACILGRRDAASLIRYVWNDTERCGGVFDRNGLAGELFAAAATAVLLEDLAPWPHDGVFPGLYGQITGPWAYVMGTP